MERDLSQSAALCRSGCGFYGSSATDGLCSKCFKDALKRKQTAPPTTSVGSGVSSSLARSSSPSLESSSLALKPPTQSENLTTGLPTVPSAIITQAHHSASNFEESNNNANDKSNQGVEDCNATAQPEITTNKVQIASHSNELDSAPPEEKKKKKTRCTKCKVNVGVIGFPCRCGGIFCSVHRYANEHSCTFDYKEHGAEEIRKNNPQVLGEKIQKI